MEIVDNKTDLKRVIRYDGFKLEKNNNITLLPIYIDCTYMRCDKFIKLVYDCYGVYPAIFYEASKTTYTLIFELYNGITLKEFKRLLEGIQNVFSKYILPSNIESEFKKPLGKIYSSRYNNILTKDIIDKLISYSTGEEQEQQAQEQLYKMKFTDSIYTEKPNKMQFGTISNELKAQVPKDITFKQLSQVILKGNTFLLCEFNSPTGYSKNNIKNVPGIGLDIDGAGIEKNQLIELIKNDFNITPIISYNTFSDVDNTRFRLIYKFDTPVSGTEYELIYNCLLNKYPNYLDPQTKNCNRLWLGTNKEVIYNEKSINISNIVLDAIKEYTPEEKEINLIPRKEVKKAIKKATTEEETILTNFYIKAQYKEEITQKIVDEISIKDFILFNYGGQYKQIGDRLTGCCPVHNGDNKTAFNIYLSSNTCHCFSHCGTMNVLTLAYKLYNTNDFSYVALKLLLDYKLGIDSEMLGEKKINRPRGGYRK